MTMTGTGNERELELVSRYLEEHFNPIRRLLGQKIPDLEVRAIAIRRCTRHIFHWQQDQTVEPDHPAYGEPVDPRSMEPEEPHHVLDDNEGQMPPDAGAAVFDEDVPADQRPPDEWVTGEEPATPRQLAVLKDRGIGVPEDCTKARASQLVTRHVYGGASA
jgi:hypothetical protein